MARSRAARRAALALSVALAAPLAGGASSLADVDGDVVAGRAALERGDAAAAIEALERAHGGAPGRGDVCWHLGRAYELEGRAADAVAFFDAAARLDPAALGEPARAASARLRARWVRVELDEGREHLSARRFEKAAEAFTRAFDLAAPDDRGSRGEARAGLAKATAGGLVAAALSGRRAGAAVALLPLLGAAPGSPHGDLAAQLEEALTHALRAAGATVLGPAGLADAAVVVQGACGQRFSLRAEDAAERGVVLARATMRALVDPPPAAPASAASAPASAASSPAPLSLELSIAAERDERLEGGAVRTARVPVAEGAVLLSGDRFRIRASVSRDAWVYAFILDAGGRATLLYPGTERLFPPLAAAGVRTPNPVRGGRELLIPPDPPTGRPYWFYLDAQTGTETFYVAAALAPLDDIEGLLRDIEAEGEAGRAAARRLAASLARRADASGVEDGAGGHLERIRGRGAVARAVSVEHR